MNIRYILKLLSFILMAMFASYSYAAERDSPLTYSGTIQSGSNNLTSTVFSPDGNYVYVGVSDGYINWYSFNNGVLTYINHIKSGSDSIEQIVVHPNGLYAYALTSNGYVNLYTINPSNGALTYVQHYNLNDVVDSSSIQWGHSMVITNNGATIAVAGLIFHKGVPAIPATFNIDVIVGSIDANGLLTLLTSHDSESIVPNNNYNQSISMASFGERGAMVGYIGDEQIFGSCLACSQTLLFNNGSMDLFKNQTISNTIGTYYVGQAGTTSQSIIYNSNGALTLFGLNVFSPTTSTSINLIGLSIIKVNADHPSDAASYNTTMTAAQLNISNTDSVGGTAISPPNHQYYLMPVGNGYVNVYFIASYLQP
ncbi:MAG: hypothetical protein K2Q03_08580 [Sphingobacteriaceae bacterium]|nr:hypothetical protein [Sphingobacteriaceae bacterium]